VDSHQARRIRATAAILAVFMAAGALAEARESGRPALRADLEELRRGILEKVDSGALPSLSVIVYAEGEAIWEEAIGWADRAKRMKATLETVYGLGSLSKSITATGMMVLVERGLVDLDAPVDQYLGEQKLTLCADTEEPVTVRHILLNSAGIPHGWYLYVLGEELPYLEGDEYIRRFGLVAFPPGKHFLYSNHSYGIAREIIANASGKSYEQFMREEVFEPLGMTSSGLTVVTTSDDVALPYLGDSVFPAALVTGPVGGATLFSSGSDLMRYARFHLGRRLPDQKQIFSDEIRDMMHTGGDDLPASLMALGWGALDMGEFGTLLLSNGEVTGANATVLLLPNRDIAIVCLANKAFSPSISDQTAFAIADALAPGILEALGRIQSEYESLYNQEYKLSDQFLGSWKGEITSPEGTVPFTMQFQEDGDIHVRLGDGLLTLLDRARIAGGFLAGSCYGYLPGHEDLAPGELSFRLIAGEDNLTGYVTWITSRTNSAGEEWAIVFPGCVSLSREATVE
jgi:CubicO group peptidase (beta-lactamase class C family)